MIDKGLLIDEYGNAQRRMHDLKEERSNLTAGSVQRKHINGNDYFYLAFREDGKVKTVYISEAEVDRYNEEILRRKGIDMTMKEIRKEIRLIEKALGRKNANDEHLRRGAQSVAELHPEYNIKRLTLFGSRATSKFRDDSDADILVEFREGFHPTLFTLSGLRLTLIDALGLNVDLLKYPLPEDSMLEIGATEVLYAG